jgi:hypothetical protein
LLAGSRAMISIIAAKAAARLAGDPPQLVRWSWSGLISQAGFSLGIAAIISRSFPTFGAPFGALAIATIAINEIIGPVFFKLGLDRTGETQQHARPEQAPDPAEEVKPA